MQTTWKRFGWVAGLLLVGCNLGSPVESVTAASADLAAADLDGDGDLDIVGSGQNRSSVLRNDGAGGFVGTTEVTDRDVTAVALGDVDGDGAVDRLELAVGAEPSGVLHLSLGDGQGGFAAPGPLTNDLPVEVMRDITLADLDQDGDPDLVTTGTATIRVRSNDGAGGFGVSRVASISCGGDFPGEHNPGRADEVAVAFVDDDDLPDVQWTGRCMNPSGERWMAGTVFDVAAPGPQTYRTTTGLTGSRVGTASADLDGDGSVDRLLGNPDEPYVEVRLERGGAPSEVVNVPTRSPVGDVEAFDVDGDGYVDVIASFATGGGAAVYYGDGTGSFGDAHALVTGGTVAGDVLVAELDGGGREDVVIGLDAEEPSGSAVLVLRNTLDGRQH